MTELLWIALGCAICLAVGVLADRLERRRAPPGPAGRVLEWSDFEAADEEFIHEGEFDP